MYDNPLNRKPGGYKSNIQDEQTSSSPHKDSHQNASWFNAQIEKVIWLPENPVNFQVSDTVIGSVYNPDKKMNEATYRINPYKCVSFFEHTQINQFDHVKNSWVISFHQDARKFREELCPVLNHFGSQGWLEHKFKNAKGSWRSEKKDIRPR